MSFDLTPLIANWRFLASGLVTTLLVSAVSILLGAAIGLVVGAGRTYGGRWLDRILPKIDVEGTEVEPPEPEEPELVGATR